MAQRLAGIAKKAMASIEPHTETVGSAIAKEYSKLLAQNAQYVVKGPEASNLGKKFVFTNLARIPEVYAQMGTEAQALKQVWAQKRELPLKELGVYALFAGELYAWFVLGEIIGRGGTITGYDFMPKH